MQTFTGYEYLLIDVANSWGKDKLVYQERIQWTEDNLQGLESLAETREWKERPLYLKAVMALRKAQQGVPTGHLVGFDATCSGMQIMSALTGCIAGGLATNLVDPDQRIDAYTVTTEEMGTILGGQVALERADIKQAVMTSFYGSTKVPKDLFGKDTPELAAFYQAVQKIAPGACELLQDLLVAWQPFAKVHEWKLPDNFHARVNVMEKVKKTIEVDELDHASFSFQFYENEGKESGLSLAANVIHSVDAYLLRSLIRRCNYDPVQLQWASHAITDVLLERNLEIHSGFAEPLCEMGDALLDCYTHTGVADTRILTYLTRRQLQVLSSEHLRKLARTVNKMLEHKPFEVVTIHDQFSCHANNMNVLRYWYKELLAELCESNVLNDVLSQLHGHPMEFDRTPNNLPELIRGSNYAIC